jgi:hypothetical protein
MRRMRPYDRTRPATVPPMREFPVSICTTTFVQFGALHPCNQGLSMLFCTYVAFAEFMALITRKPCGLRVQHLSSYCVFGFMPYPTWAMTCGAQGCPDPMQAAHLTARSLFYRCTCTPPRIECLNHTGHGKCLDLGPRDAFT